MPLPVEMPAPVKVTILCAWRIRFASWPMSHSIASLSAKAAFEQKVFDLLRLSVLCDFPRMAIPVITVAQMRDWEKATWAAGQTEGEVIRRVGLAVANCALGLT